MTITTQTKEDTFSFRDLKPGIKLQNSWIEETSIIEAETRFVEYGLSHSIQESTGEKRYVVVTRRRRESSRYANSILFCY